MLWSFHARFGRRTLPLKQGCQTHFGSAATYSPSDLKWAGTTRLVVGVISAMVEKEQGERIFGFASLNEPLNEGERDCC